MKLILILKLTILGVNAVTPSISCRKDEDCEHGKACIPPGLGTCTCGIMEPWGDCLNYKDICKSGEECVKNPEYLKCISSGGCFCQSQ
eukprot:08630.XXX_492273_491957_1 [CDS] Oithona nana genome sequencing.